MDHPIRIDLEEREARSLSPYACLSRNSKGRVRPEQECDVRVSFQRDRDRIIHCKTFRRLIHKTQVFLSPTGDHYRTRLTHVLEVSQIARTVSVALQLNGHLTEAIALAHDMGHTPFGHAGESMLNDLYPSGFRHFEQSLRVVDILENSGRGLNLTTEVRDGILKHSKGRRQILPDDISKLPETLEGRVVRIADIMAYVNHDLDDAVRAGIIDDATVPKDILDLIGRTYSARINTMVKDIIYSTIEAGGDRLAMSPDLLGAVTELRNFLFENVYAADRVHDEFVKAMRVVRELYGHFMQNRFPGEQTPIPADQKRRHRQVCDFVAGMTDRYALAIYQEIFLPKPWSVL